MTDKYCIKDGYTDNIEGGECDVTNQIVDGTGDSMQKEVYLKATQFKGSVMDIGCGCGYKLIKYFGDRITLGTEIEPNYEFLKKQYPDRDWRYSDFNQCPYYDIVICADVIEHLKDPDDLMACIRTINPKHFVLSTPDREMLPISCRRPDGPPANHRHFREWTTKEFLEYIKVWLPDYTLNHKTDESNIIVWGSRC